MKKQTKNYLKIALTFLVVGIIGTSVIWVYASPGSTFYISKGIYPGGVWTGEKDGSNYYIKNPYGKLVYEGSNGSVVLQNALNAIGLAGGDTLRLKAGEYWAENLRIKYNYINIEGEGPYNTVIRTWENTTNILNLYKDDYSPLVGLVLSNFGLQGGGSNSNGSGLYACNLWYSDLINLRASYCYDGFRFWGNGSASLRGARNYLQSCIALLCNGNGFRFTQQDCYTLIDCSSHSNIVGYRFDDHTQGFNLFGCHSATNTQTGYSTIYSQCIYFEECYASGNGFYGLSVLDGCMNIEWRGYVEASGLDGILIDAVSWSNRDIKILYSIIVKCEHYGINIVSKNGWNNTYISISYSDILNNGNASSNLYEGIYISDDASSGSGSKNISISYCNIGNAPDYWGKETGNNYQRGIKSLSLSDYIEVSYVNTNTAIGLGIGLIGSNNIVTHSWNLTSRIGDET